MAKKRRIVAAIEISGGGIEMKVGSGGKGGVKVIDTLFYPLAIGRDTFTKGRVNFDRADKACVILKNFAGAAREYGADELLCLSGAALREAENKDYVLEQIRVKTGIEVEMLDDRQEKTRIYKHMRAITPTEFTQSALFAHVGNGNLGVCVFEKGKVSVFKNVRLGSLRVSETFHERRDMRGFRLFVEEYMAGLTDSLEGLLPKNIGRFAVCGGDIDFLRQAFGLNAEGESVSLEAFSGVYESAANMTAERASEIYGISKDDAEALSPALTILKDLLAYVSADRIYMPRADLSGAALLSALSEEVSAKIDIEFEESAVHSARLAAARFGCGERHLNAVASACLTIFDKLRKTHGLGGHERLLLHIAAILHDSGKMISLKSHYRHSYNIIMGLEIVGLSADDMEIIANAALYHSSPSPKVTDANFRAMRTRNRGITAKLSAIIRLADALDASHKQKWTDLDAFVSGETFTVAAKAKADMALELWSFERKGLYFKEVFGLDAVLKAKRS